MELNVVKVITIFILILQLKINRMNIHSKWSKPWITGGKWEKEYLFIHNNNTM